MSMINKNKRFISGAICTKCHKMDTIKMWRIDSVSYQECINCGQLIELPMDNDISLNEVDTRVSRDILAGKQEHENWQTIKFFPSPNRKKME